MLIKTASPNELPDCCHTFKPLLITPSKPTPTQTLPLSNLDDQLFLRFSIKYLYLFKKSLSVDVLKSSLALALVHYYPLAGRLRVSPSNDHKLEVDCNGEGAVFVEAFMDLEANEFLEIANKKPNKSWRKLLHRVDGATSFIDIPPLVVQVTYLRCGGMILSTAISHCLCDGIGTSQFLHAWAYLAANNDDAELNIQPFHYRSVLNPRNPPLVKFDHPAYCRSSSDSDCDYNLFKWLHSQPLVASSVVFNGEDILKLKRRCSPSIKCTSFEALACHTWRSWVESLTLPMNRSLKLVFSINVREKMSDEIPKGYYGNAFVLGCAQTTVKGLVNSNLHDAVALVQAAKTASNGECVRSLIDLLEDECVKTDLRGTFVISQWSKLGLEEVNFGGGGGNCMYMGAVASDVCCLFLPVIGQKESVRVLVSMPEAVVEKFEGFMKGFLDEKEECNTGKDGWMDTYF